MEHWQEDSDFASVREAARLAKLPADERAAWQAFWQELEALRRQAGKIPAKANAKQQRRVRQTIC